MCIRDRASSSFAETILAIGISAVWGAAMINSGATVLDHLPHGSFFHATGGVCELNFKERLKLIPYESVSYTHLDVYKRQGSSRCPGYCRGS